MMNKLSYGRNGYNKTLQRLLCVFTFMLGFYCVVMEDDAMTASVQVENNYLLWTQNTSQYNLEEGLIAHFTLNNTFADSSNYARHCYLYGTEEYVPGQFGQALSLDGASYIECTSMADFEVENLSLTFSAWVTIPDNASKYASAYKPFIVLEDRNPARMTRIVLGKTRRYQEHEFEEDPSYEPLKQHEGRLWMEIVDRSMGTETSKVHVYSVDDGEALPKYEWLHVVGILDSTQQQVKLYLNGQLQESEILGTTLDLIDTQSLILRIGGASYNLSRHNGQLDEVRIYNRVLNIQEILALHQAGIYENQAQQGCVPIGKATDNTGTGIIRIGDTMECGAACDEFHAPCAQPTPEWTLEVTPDEHSQFLGWEGSDKCILPDQKTAIFEKLATASASAKTECRSLYHKSKQCILDVASQPNSACKDPALDTSHPDYTPPLSVCTPQYGSIICCLEENDLLACIDMLGLLNKGYKCEEVVGGPECPKEGCNEELGAAGCSEIGRDFYACADVVLDECRQCLLEAFNKKITVCIPFLGCEEYPGPCNEAKDEANACLLDPDLKNRFPQNIECFAMLSFIRKEADCAAELVVRGCLSKCLE